MADVKIIMRFVTSDDPVAILIRAHGGISMPFTPSHVEALSRTGKAWTGQHLDGGCEERPLDYYQAEPHMREVQVPITVAQSQYDSFHTYLENRIGDSYDWRAIIGFMLPDIHMHEPGGQICSALMVMCLRAAKVFPWPLTVPAHHISPRDLMLILSSLQEIDH